MAKITYLDFPDGLKMPVVGLGTWQATNEAELEKALDVALEIGYRHIDTAYVYGNEAVIGRVLKKWLSSGKLKREDLFITTKLPIYGVHPDRVDMFMKKSLENLQLSYVDLYLIHFPVGCKYDADNTEKPLKMTEKGEVDTEPNVDHPAIWKKMEAQLDAGRTKTIGLSNFNVRQIDNVLKSARIRPANLQVELHVYLQQPELVNFCKKNGITLVAYSPLGSPGFNTFLKNLGQEPKALPSILSDPVVKKLADKHGKLPSQIVLRYLVQNGIAVIPKSVTPERLKKNIELFDFQLDDSDMAALKALDQGEKGRVCDFLCFPGLNKHPEFPMKSA